MNQKHLKYNNVKIRKNSVSDDNSQHIIINTTKLIKMISYHDNKEITKLLTLIASKRKKNKST